MNTNKPAVSPELKKIMDNQENNRKVEDEEKLPKEHVAYFYLGGLYDRYLVLQELERGCKKLPFKLAWIIDDNKELLKGFANKYELRLKEILQEFAEPSPVQSGIPGQTAYNIKKPVEYKKAADELYGLEVEFDERKIKSIAFKDLENVNDLEISVDTLRSLRMYGMVV